MRHSREAWLRPTRIGGPRFEIRAFAACNHRPRHTHDGTRGLWTRGSRRTDRGADACAGRQANDCTGRRADYRASRRCHHGPSCRRQANDCAGRRASGDGCTERRSAATA